MNREQLAHILRAASTIVDGSNILVIGSQSDAATASMEVDLAFFDDPTKDKADAVDGAIGELCPFHEMDGVYAQGVSVRTAVLPEGWRGRVVPGQTSPPVGLWRRFSSRTTALCPSSWHIGTRTSRSLLPCSSPGLIDPMILARRIDRLPASGSAGTEEAALMVEVLGRTTPTRLTSSPTSDRRPSSSGLLTGSAGPSMPSTRQREHP